MVVNRRDVYLFSYAFDLFEKRDIISLPQLKNWRVWPKNKKSFHFRIDKHREAVFEEFRRIDGREFHENPNTIAGITDVRFDRAYIYYGMYGL